MQLCFMTAKLFTFTFMHLADAFIQSDLQCIQAIHLFCQYVMFNRLVYVFLFYSETSFFSHNKTITTWLNILYELH